MTATWRGLWQRVRDAMRRRWGAWRPRLPDAPAHATGTFVAASFSNAAGTRQYHVYRPSRPSTRPSPMLVMLHGCKQDPVDFAAGTRMNGWAEALGWRVLYPGQSQAANPWRCWNWFRRVNQQAGHGEASIIAEMALQVAETEGVAADRIYVAGLSAGGAMAAIVASAYPEVFAAAGIHSGLPPGAAEDPVSALKAMKHGPASPGRRREGRRTVPTIVFHGDRDETVHPGNGAEVIVQARWQPLDSGPGQVRTERGQVAGGRAWSRTLHLDDRGRCDAEHWVVHDAGHAWSGGSVDGSFTDPLGPDASREMVRFFLDKVRPG